MSQTSVNFRMDESDKNEFEKICREIGLNMSSAFNIFAKAVIREQGIPFDVVTKNPNSETLLALREAELVLENPTVYQAYSTFREALAELERKDEI